MHKILRINFDDPLYAQVFALRYKVLREPLGLQYSPEEIIRDRKVTYFGYLEEDELLGVVGLDFVKEGWGKLMQMAVDTSRHKSGIGRELVTELENYCKSLGMKGVYLDSRYDAHGFYEKLGYRVFGEIYDKIGIPHINMAKKLI